MKTRVVMGVALVLVMGAGGARAETWRCVSAGGSVVYTQSTPCRGDTRDVRAGPAPRATPATTRVAVPGRTRGVVDLYPGMASAEVWAAIGLPDSEESVSVGGEVAQTWVYRQSSVGALVISLRGGRVASWSEVRSR